MKVDSDHAGCVRTRKSTTGLAAFYGKHMFKAASTTQTLIALSSGESEFYAIVRGVATGGHSRDRDGFGGGTRCGTETRCR